MFDTHAFRGSLLRRIPAAVDVIVSVSAGSVIADAVIVMPSLEYAQAAATTINTTPDTVKIGWFTQGVLRRSDSASAQIMMLDPSISPSLPQPMSIGYHTAVLLSFDMQLALLALLALCTFSFLCHIGSRLRGHLNTSKHLAICVDTTVGSALANGPHDEHTNKKDLPLDLAMEDIEARVETNALHHLAMKRARAGEGSVPLDV